MGKIYNPFAWNYINVKYRKEKNCELINFIFDKLLNSM